MLGLIKMIVHANAMHSCLNFINRTIDIQGKLKIVNSVYKVVSQILAEFRPEIEGNIQNFA